MTEATEKCPYCSDTGWVMMSKPGQIINGVMHMIEFPQICYACPAGKKELEKLSINQQERNT